MSSTSSAVQRWRDPTVAAATADGCERIRTLPPCASALRGTARHGGLGALLADFRQRECLRAGVHVREGHVSC
eukprot:6452014-Prymnesium_polylepis.1